MDRLRPYDLFQVGTVGAARALIAPFDAVDAPEGIQDVIDMVYPYTPKTGWLNSGASTDGKSYTRGMDSEGIDIQEESGNLFEDITETNRQFVVPFSEMKPEFEEIIENGVALDDIPASAGVSEQAAVGLTSITTLNVYRIAFLGVRRKESGVVVEPSPSGRERGRLVMKCANRVTIATEDAETGWEKGSLSGTPVTFVAFPDGEVDPAEGDWGRTLFEKAGTVGSDAS